MTTTTQVTGAEEVGWDLSDLYDGPEDPKLQGFGLDDWNRVTGTESEGGDAGDASDSQDADDAEGNEQAGAGAEPEADEDAEAGADAK